MAMDMHPDTQDWLTFLGKTDIMSEFKLPFAEAFISKNTTVALLQSACKESSLDETKAFVKDVLDAIKLDGPPLHQFVKVSMINEIVNRAKKIDKRIKLQQLLTLNITDYGYKKYKLQSKTHQSVYISPYDKLPWPDSKQEMAEFLFDFAQQDRNREFKKPKKNQFEAVIENEACLYEQFRKIVDATICLVIDPTRFSIQPRKCVVGGICDYVLVDHVLRKAIVSIEIKTDRKLLNETICENRKNQLVGYLRKVNFGLLTTINDTLMVEKHREMRNGKPYTYVKISRPVDETDFVSALSFVCLKAIRYHMIQLETARSNPSRPLPHSNSRRDEYDEDSESESEDEADSYKDSSANNTIFKTEQLTSSKYHRDVDVLHNKNELAMLLSSFSTLKVTLDYEDEENTDSGPYAEGASGCVFLGYVSAKNKANKIRCAAKIAEIDKFKPGSVYDLCQEARILSYLNRCGVSCVPKLLYSGFLASTAFFAVVTEFVENARCFNLDTLKQRRAGLLAKAINDVHSVGVQHGDLVSSNVLFQRLANGQERCVLIDFAFSTLFVRPLPFIVLSPISLINRDNEFQDEMEWIARQNKEDKRQLKKLYRSFKEWFTNTEDSTINLSEESMIKSC